MKSMILVITAIGIMFSAQSFGDVEIINPSEGDEVNRDMFSIIAKGAGYGAGEPLMITVTIQELATGFSTTEIVSVVTKGKGKPIAFADDVQLDNADVLIEYIAEQSAEFVMLCHVPKNNHFNAKVIVLAVSAADAILSKDRWDYLIPWDEAPFPGDWCDPYAAVN